MSETQALALAWRWAIAAPVTAATTTVLAAFLFWNIYQSLREHKVSREFARKLGCKAIKRSPQKDPFLALDIFARLGKAASERTYLQTIQHWFEDVAPTFAVRLMGDDMIFTNEPKNIQAMLVSNFKTFEIGERRRQNSHQLLGIGVFNADGKTWERGRALVKPNFSRKQVSDLQTFETHVQALMRAIPADGSPIEMQEWFFRFTLDVGTEYLFGETSGILDPNATELAKSFAWAFDVGVDGISQRIRLGKFARFYHDRRYSKACSVVHGYVEPIVEKTIRQARLEKPSQELERDERYTFLVEMARQGASPKEMRDQVLNILVAARDTSACLQSAAFFEMGQHPELLQRLREEVSSLEGGLPTYEDIKNMRFLNNFIKETLRLHPPVPLNARVSCEDTFLPLGGGPDGKSPIFVPKGKLCVYQIYSMHRRKDLWGDKAEEFDPSRWNSIRPTFEYLPFNAGPRICPGQQFALTETAYVIIRLLQTYSTIEACETGVSWYENLTLTCSTGPGVWLRFHR
ncbi:hypothetical protein AC578_8907 [Pseudocercospora eumusae]|uniref:Cytochrome P450 n=1 Tax=Pseudocercospora eumusae TaxID=321146 RepID=A0A139HMX1_9PEZI|nr:hypothetical protein AC578_8907 [Pseudocercospora eumusae]KXT03844.1 hypothetical protein AC578_8907 [Pseudocercospora eumusae]KXT03845.1 hypothetical protein AC578_8907 [Pseudocercospora eumusae]